MGWDAMGMWKGRGQECGNGDGTEIGGDGTGGEGMVMASDVEWGL